MTATIAGWLDDADVTMPDQRLLLDVDGGMLVLALTAR